MKKTIFILTLLLPFGLLCAQSNVYQDGGANWVKVEQVGEENHSNVETHGWFNAFSFVDQEGNGVNNSMVFQDGNGNNANVSQDNDYQLWWHDNNSNVNQTGNWNSAKVDQIAQEREWGFNWRNADINQPGSFNRADIQQEGILLNANTFQEGFGGSAKQYQGKNTYLTAVGKFNDANIHQTTNVSFGTRAEQYQDGQQNDANIEQNSGFFSKAIQIQMNAEEDYTGFLFTNVNQAMINQQNGVGNTAIQVQYYPADGDNFGANVADVYQDGSWNYSQEIQLGGDNSSVVTQMGNGNVSSVFQNEHTIDSPIPSLNQYLPTIGY
jgi:hypothetical protein